jgi:hypothetical protein
MFFQGRGPIRALLITLLFILAFVFGQSGYCNDCNFASINGSDNDHIRFRPNQKGSFDALVPGEDWIEGVAVTAGGDQTSHRFRELNFELVPPSNGIGRGLIRNLSSGNTRNIEFRP